MTILLILFLTLYAFFGVWVVTVERPQHWQAAFIMVVAWPLLLLWEPFR